MTCSRLGNGTTRQATLTSRSLGPTGSTPLPSIRNLPSSEFGESSYHAKGHMTSLLYAVSSPISEINTHGCGETSRKINIDPRSTWLGRRSVLVVVSDAVLTLYECRTLLSDNRYLLCTCVLVDILNVRQVQIDRAWLVGSSRVVHTVHRRILCLRFSKGVESCEATQ